MDPKHRVYYYVNLGFWKYYEENLERLRSAVPSLKMRPLPYSPPCAREYKEAYDFHWVKWQMTVSCLKRDEGALLDVLGTSKGVRFERVEE